MPFVFTGGWFKVCMERISPNENGPIFSVGGQCLVVEYHSQRLRSCYVMLRVSQILSLTERRKKEKDKVLISFTLALQDILLYSYKY